MIRALMEQFINPIFLYGLEYILVIAALLLLAVALLLWRRHFITAALCFILLTTLLGSVPLYRDTVLRARDAEPVVVRLWRLAYPGAFALTAEGEPGLPHFSRATQARVKAMLPGGVDMFSWADDCLRRMEGRGGTKRRYAFYNLADKSLPVFCTDLAGMKENYRIDLSAILQREYEVFRAYAAGVAAYDRGVQKNCPAFYSVRGQHQKKIPDPATGLMKPEYDLSANNCACVARNRHSGCREIDEKDREEGYVAHFRQYDFYSPLTCDLSEICTVLRDAGIKLPLAGAAPDLPEVEKERRIGAATEKCIRNGYFQPEKRAEYCACASHILMGQDERVLRLSPGAAQCWLERGGLDDDQCVIGEGDWVAAGRAVFLCTLEGAPEREGRAP